MARYTGASCRQCRREGMKLFLKGDRCYTDKCAVVKKKLCSRTTWTSKKESYLIWITIKRKTKS